MKRASLLKSLAKLQTRGAGMKSSQFLVILAGLTFAGWLASPALAVNGNSAKNYKAVISPSPVEGGKPTTFTLTITNCTDAACGAGNGSGANQQLGAVDVTVPNVFSNVVLGAVTATGVHPGNGNVPNAWHATLTSGVIHLRGNTGADKLNPGQYVSVLVTAMVPCQPGDYFWTTKASNQVDPVTDWNFHLIGADPKVTISGCDPEMPVNKLINGEPATCTAIQQGGQPDPNGNPNFTRPCTYTQAGLVLLDTDPRFNINVYTTVNGLPGVALSNGLPFPQAGPKIPPQFDTNVPGGLSFTMCEAPDTTTSPTPYTLTGVRITVTPPGNLFLFPAIYFVVPPFLDPPTNSIANTNGLRYGCFNTTVPLNATVFAVDINDSIVCTYTKGGYGQDFGTNTIGQILSTNFPTVFPSGVQVGDRTTIGTLDGSTNGWGALFTSAAAVRAYLPVQGGAGSVEGALTRDYQDPTATSNPRPKGFAEQVLALQMNVDLGDAGKFLPGGGGIGNFQVFTGANQCEDGKTVRDILTDANKALAGLLPLPTNCTLAALQDLADKLNNSFDDCKAGPWSDLFIAK